jgi:hypothetical protein
MATTFYEDMLERKRRMLPLSLGAQSVGGTLTQDVTPGQSQQLSPQTYLTRAAELRRRQAEAEDMQPDTATLEQMMRQRSESGGSAMLNALAAQFAGESFQPVQAQFLKRAMSAQEPMKLTGGMIGPDGKFVADPLFNQERRAARYGREAEAAEGAARAMTEAEARREQARASQAAQEELRRMGLGIQQQNADTSRALADFRLSQPKPEDTRTFTRATNLRNELSKRSDKIQEGTRHAETVISLLGDPAIARDPTKQVSLVFAFGKMLDPESVVRESEYALISNARGMFESLLQKPDQIMTGARLTPQQLNSMKEIASRLYSGSTQRRSDLMDYYRGIAQRNNIPVEDVLPMGSSPARPNDLAAAAAAELARRSGGAK